MDWSNAGNVKRVGAILGSAAVVVALAMSLAGYQQQVRSDTVATSPMTIGATSTKTTPPSVEATSMAVPSITGPAPLPSEEENAK